MKRRYNLNQIIKQLKNPKFIETAQIKELQKRVKRLEQKIGIK